MEIIVLTDDIFELIPVKELMKDIVLVQETDLFELCEIHTTQTDNVFRYTY